MTWLIAEPPSNRTAQWAEQGEAPLHRGAGCWNAAPEDARQAHWTEQTDGTCAGSRTLQAMGDVKASKSWQDTPRSACLQHLTACDRRSCQAGGAVRLGEHANDGLLAQTLMPWHMGCLSLGHNKC